MSLIAWDSRSPAELRGLVPLLSELLEILRLAQRDA